MTSEVCLLNRFGAVLAADSAITVSYWDPDAEKSVDRYFKGANKIFQLSAHHPVGLMIYENSSLHSVPWEILVKEFRTELKNTAYESPKAYANAFFEFLHRSTWLFPNDILDHHTQLQGFWAILALFWENGIRDPIVVQTDEEKKLKFQVAFQAKQTQLNNKPFPAIFDTEEAKRNIHRQAENVAKTIDMFAKAVDLDAKDLGLFGIETVIKTYEESLRNSLTGIIVAGFGEREPFPSFCEFKCYGFFCGKLLVTEESAAQINYEYVAAMKGFAQASMVETFEMGVSFDVYAKTRMLFETAAKQGIALTTGDKATLESDGLKAKIDDLAKNLAKDWLTEARKTHRDPLHRVIGSLSVSEMAELAETLISLQSLKEKVTRPSESVGGPVDVAVISRAEGLVWVKRKHYFDGSLNPRYFLRQKELYG